MKHSRKRYQEPWLQAWDEIVAREMRPGIQILDVGSGRRPAIPPEQRPPNCTYVGLDLSMDELKAAPRGSYDEMVASDVLASSFFSSEPQPARARPSTTAMIAIPPALTLLIGSPVSVEIRAMSLRSANARCKRSRSVSQPHPF